ncbi:MAG: ribosome assembly RNA-binding protein YhbY [Clostridiales bacterium]|nr:ribosome assembly RNA-binding protein YhbY [Clostridiales bacterium]
MFTSKQRSVLRSIAQTIEPIGQIGKGGISENMVKTFSEALEARELIKLTLLNNSDEDIKEISTELAEKLGAEVVCTIGHKIVLYRYSNKKGIKHIKY